MFITSVFIQVRLFLGGRLDYESRRCAKHKAEHQHEPHLITAVKFSTEEPYGTTVALLDMKSGTVKVLLLCVKELSHVRLSILITHHFIAIFGILGKRRLVRFAQPHSYIYTR